MSTLADRRVLFSPFDLHGLHLPNRFVMSPMTRARVPANAVPDVLSALYYSQRAGAGLVITEGACILPGGTGTPGVAAIFEKAHIEGWRAVAQAVHAADGRIFLQLWHTGRVSLTLWQPDGGPPLGPSAIRAAGARARSPDGAVHEPDVPRAATLVDIRTLIEGYAQAARNALAAGMDGVEVHACNGYLLQQFLSDAANQRTDAYGGSVLNRCRLPLEVVEAVIGAVGRERTGVRVSPLARHQGAPISDPEAVFGTLIPALDALRVGHIHCAEGEPGAENLTDPRVRERFDFMAARKRFRGAWIANNGYDVDRAAQAVGCGYADLVSFGRPFVSNPDLVRRAELSAALNPIDSTTIYGGGARGYTDYPSL